MLALTLQNSFTMALKQCELNKIPVRNKDLAFGYVKECERMHGSVIPSMIKYLCLIYLNSNKDTFDPSNTHKTIKIYGDCIEADRYSTATACLQNVVDSGIHIWKFKCITSEFADVIGITKAMALPKDMRYLDCNGDTCVGYAFTSEGQMTNIKDVTEWGDKYGDGWKSGDLIEMMVDFTKLQLSLKINDIDCGKVFHIDETKYKAAISVDSWTSYASYSLTSYQHIY